MTKKNKRINSLLDLLKEKSTLKLTDIEKHFNISESTARRLCVELEQNGNVIRTFGGIKYLPENHVVNGHSYSFNLLTNQHADEKRRIANYALSQIEHGDTIFLSSGTTIYQLAAQLAEKIKTNQLMNVTIMTNSIANAEVLSPCVKVVLTGGEYRCERKDTIGLIGEKAISGAKFSKVFMGLDAIDISDGLMTWDIDTARIDYLAINNSSKVFLLIDSSKFINKSFINYEKLSPEYTIITDTALESNILDAAKSSGQSIILV